MQKYVGVDITSMVTLLVLIFEPMTMLQKMAELMEYAHLLEQADNCEDPYMRLVYTVYYALQQTWKPFNPILGETYEMVSHHPPISDAHAENEHFVYDITSKNSFEAKERWINSRISTPSNKSHQFNIWKNIVGSGA
uniref:Uncharacterized protein n=1 Tax=Lactuca sativa TaxID=4236 RepID=A0A9R1VG74_LACSA|nr:hypothetical protein LSAT_V11C500237780 [Lactuca sativa]